MPSYVCDSAERSDVLLSVINFSNPSPKYSRQCRYCALNPDGQMFALPLPGWSRSHWQGCWSDAVIQLHC